MSDLMVSGREHAFTTLRDLQVSSGDQGVTVTDYVKAMQALEITADEAVSVLQDLIADSEVQLTNRYRIRVS